MKKAAILALLLPALISCGKKGDLHFETAKAELRDLSTSVTATGTIEPVTKVEVGTQVSGIIDKIYVDYNSEVTKGQIIAELDKTNLLAELANAKSNLANAQSSLDYQTANYNRYKTLYDKGLISADDFEQARLSYEQARQQVAIEEQNVSKAQTNLGYATITSPIDGVVLSREVEEGQTVASSMTTPTLFILARDLTDMRVIADVDEADIGEVKEGQHVTFTVDAYPDDIFEGAVTQVRQNATTESNVVTYEVVISARNDELKLKPGLTANVTIFSAECKDVLSVPSSALKFTPNQELLPEGDRIVDSEATTKVWMQAGHDVKAVPVTVGMTGGSFVQITSGLKAGDMVIVGMTDNTVVAADESEDGSNPFMPGPPGKKNKNRQAMVNKDKVIIELRDVKRKFIVGDEKVYALRGVSFKIYEGEFVTIMGTSGSGKSTLLNQLGCLDTPSSGEYILDGMSVRKMSKNQRARLRNRKIGFVFQNYNLLPKTTSVENVELPLMYNKEYSAKQRKEAAIKVLKEVGLGHRLDHKPNQMSGGQMQRVAIARALVNNPAVILADEATGNLDTRTSFEMLVLFQKLYSEGHTIIFVTHNPELAKYSSRNILLRDGRIVDDTINTNILSAKETLDNLPVEETVDDLITESESRDD